ncbi:MAG: hypothetical protein Q8L34_04515 [Candidatus Woesearchaeota archaeon]|nr:hypothetical protein [Candidatus Woesearchaeota archaeon]
MNELALTLDIKARGLVDIVEKDILRELSNETMSLNLISKLAKRMADFGLSIEHPEHLEAVYSQAKQKINEENLFPPVSICIGNKSIEFEPNVYSIHGKKKSLDPNISLQRSRKAGYRHPYPSEIFGLIMYGLEYQLSDNLESLYKDLCAENQTIWLGLAFETVGDSLVAYVDPENFDIHNQRQDLADFKYSYLSIFDIEGLPSKKCIDIYDVDEKLVKFLYGISFGDLNYIIKGNNLPIPQIILPPEGKIWPVSRGGHCNSVIGGVCGYGRRESYSLGVKSL